MRRGVMGGSKRPKPGLEKREKRKLGKISGEVVSGGANEFS